MATIQGFVREHKNLDNGIPNVEIALIDSNGVLTTTVTNASGKYIFKNVNEEGRYKICEMLEEQPIGYETSASRHLYVADIDEHSQIVTIQEFAHLKTDLYTFISTNTTTNVFSKKQIISQATNESNSIIYSIIKSENYLITQSTGDNSDQIIYKYTDIPKFDKKLDKVIEITFDENGYLYLVFIEENSKNTVEKISFCVIDTTNINSMNYMMPIKSNNKAEVDYDGEGTTIRGIPLNLKKEKYMKWQYSKTSKMLELLCDGEVYQIDKITGTARKEVKLEKETKTIKEKPVIKENKENKEKTDKIETVETIETIETVETIENVEQNKTTYSIKSSEINKVKEVAMSNLSSSNKSATPFILGVGDIITYTINIINTGDRDATNVVVSDILSKGATYIQGTLTVNGDEVAYSPDNLYIGNISVGKTYVVQFKAKVNYIPSSGNIKGVATINYSDETGIQRSTSTNTTQTSLQSPDFRGEEFDNFAIEADCLYATVGDIVSYKIIIRNTGSLSAINATLRTDLPSNTSLVPGSITINGGFSAIEDISSGIYIGKINANEEKEILLKLKINSNAEKNQLINTARLEYNYESTTLKEGVVDSNITLVNLRGGYINPQNLSMTTQKNSVSINDIIVYEISMKNEGNQDINNCIIKKCLPKGTEFIAGSVSIDGIYDRGQNLEEGIFIESLIPNQIMKISFRVKVVDETIALITNKANIVYNTSVNPNESNKLKSIFTNISTIYNSNPTISIKQSANRNNVVVGETITYDVEIKNIGNVDIANVVLNNQISSSLQYVDEVYIDNVATKVDLSSIDGVQISKIYKDQVVKMTYKTKVASVENRIASIMKARFEYMNPDGISGYLSTESDECKVNGIDTKINVSNECSNYKSNVGANFDITIKMKNIGNADAIGTIITDMLPDALKVEKITIDGVIAEGDIRKGIEGGPLVIDDTKTVVINVTAISSLPFEYINDANICFKYKLEEDDEIVSIRYEEAIDPNPISISSAKLEIITSTLKTSVLEGEIVPYTIVIKNIGGVNIENIKLIDNLPEGLEFVKGTVKVNETLYDDIDISAGLKIPLIKVRGSYVISFDTKVVGIGKIKNNVVAEFEYKEVNHPQTKVGTDESNEVSIHSFNGDLKLIKTANVRETQLDEVVSYNVEIRNDSDIDALEVVFKDDIPDYLELIPNSFMVNNKQIFKVEPKYGVLVPNIPRKGNLTISYKCKVRGANDDKEIINKAKIKCKYKLPDGTNGSIETSPENGGTSIVKLMNLNKYNTVNENKNNNVNKNENIEINKTENVEMKKSNNEPEIPMNERILNTLIIEEYLKIPTSHPDIDSINKIDTRIELVDHELVETTNPRNNNTNREYALILKGFVHEIVEYNSTVNAQRPFTASYKVPFTTQVKLPKTFNVGDDLSINASVEENHYNKVDERVLVSSVVIIVKLKS